MAIFQRVNGDSQGIVNYDISLNGVSSVGKIIANAIGKHPTCFKVIGGATFNTEMGVGGAVETLLRVIQTASTTNMYQVDATQVSILVEATGFPTDAALQAVIQAIPVTATTSGYDFSTTTVTSTNGFKLA